MCLKVLERCQFWMYWQIAKSEIYKQTKAKTSFRITIKYCKHVCWTIKVWHHELIQLICGAINNQKQRNRNRRRNQNVLKNCFNLQMCDSKESEFDNECSLVFIVVECYKMLFKFKLAFSHNNWMKIDLFLLNLFADDLKANCFEIK